MLPNCPAKPSPEGIGGREIVSVTSSGYYEKLSSGRRHRSKYARLFVVNKTVVPTVCLSALLAGGLPI